MGIGLQVGLVTKPWRHQMLAVFTVCMATFWSHAAWALNFGHSTDTPVWVLDRAQLHTASTDAWVDLPYRLKAHEFKPQGETVVFALTLDLPTLPDKPLAVYVPKLSLSGAFYLNGHWVANCGAETLALSRCLHRPHLFTPPMNLWQPGVNELVFRILSNNQQMNGLSQVKVGDAVALHHNHLAPSLFWRVSVIQALMWVSVGLGLISLGISAVLRRTPTYFWFGLCCLTYAVSCVNELLVNFPKDPSLLSWLIFSSRMVTVPLLLLTFLTALPDRLKTLKTGLMAFALLAPVLIAVSGNSRTVVMGLYVPLMAASVVAIGYLLYWGWRKRGPSMVLSGVGLLFFVLIGGIDWLRLSGRTSFEGALLGSYAFGGLLLVVGGFLSITLADALRISRNFRVRLEGEVQKRTLQIEQLNRELTLLEVERTRVQVREKLIQDMHDGFGSQLATARIMAKNHDLSPTEMGQLLDDCLTDLQLVVDTHLASSHHLCDVLFDFKHRLQQRLGHTPLQFQCVIEVPEGQWLSQDKTLQFLRVLQEAVSNALRHAQASELSLLVKLDDAQAQLVAWVQDNGQGLVSAQGVGRGLNTMKSRVRELGGQFSIESEAGVIVHIQVPVDSPMESPA